VEALFNVATGLAEGYILPPQDHGRGPKWWDIAPGVSVLTSNGGVITDIYGDPYVPKNNTRGLLASNGKIHSELIDAIRLAYR
jgi:fructose-1,6-bisphosphatase/inositol monophosphatase family enzyme